MIQVPEIVRRYYSELIWKVETDDKDLYLTFDDGPTKGVTEWTLDLLKEFDAKATFFCIGKNVEKQPEIFERIKQEGHAVGNHTYDHIKGWTSRNFDYMKSVMKCDDLVQSPLFRPPYGKIKKNQIKGLKERFKIVMWDVLSEDYNPSLSADSCFNKVEKHVGKGSIIVFHDSKKAYKNLQVLLPKVLRYYKNQGYSFKSLE